MMDKVKYWEQCETLIQLLYCLEGRVKTTLFLVVLYVLSFLIVLALFFW